MHVAVLGFFRLITTLTALLKEVLFLGPTRLAESMEGTVCNVHGDQDSPKGGEYTYNEMLEFGMVTVKEGNSGIKSICNFLNVVSLVDDGAP